MSRKNVKVFKILTKGFGESFVEMGNVLISAEKNRIPNDLKIEIIAKLGMAEDLVYEVCKDLNGIKTQKNK